MPQSLQSPSRPQVRQDAEFKEKLRQLSPPESDEVLIKQKLTPALVNGELAFRGHGPKTVDFWHHACAISSWLNTCRAEMAKSGEKPRAYSG